MSAHLVCISRSQNPEPVCFMIFDPRHLKSDFGNTSCTMVCSTPFICKRQSFNRIHKQRSNSSLRSLDEQQFVDRRLQPAFPLTRTWLGIQREKCVCSLRRTTSKTELVHHSSSPSHSEALSTRAGSTRLERHTLPSSAPKRRYSLPPLLQGSALILLSFYSMATVVGAFRLQAAPVCFFLTGLVYVHHSSHHLLLFPLGSLDSWRQPFR